ncbi:MAG: nucleotidyltransferase domain-containing protein [Pseudomonadota bacterium]
MSRRPVSEYRFLHDLEALPFVEAIYLFGSRARRDNAERADIDLAVLCPTASARDWQRVLDVIEAADTLLKIDCLRLDELRPDDPLRKNVLRHHSVLYRKAAA